MIMYICMLPIYTTILPIYAICNSHDISWGNQPMVAHYQQLSVHPVIMKTFVQKYKIKRIIVFFVWFLANLGYISLVDLFLTE